MATNTSINISTAGLSPNIRNYAGNLTDPSENLVNLVRERLKTLEEELSKANAEIELLKRTQLPLVALPSSPAKNSGVITQLQQANSKLEQEKRDMADGMKRLEKAALRGDPLSRHEQIPELEILRKVLLDLRNLNANPIPAAQIAATPLPASAKGSDEVKPLSDRERRQLEQTKKEVLDLRVNGVQLLTKLEEAKTEVAKLKAQLAQLQAKQQNGTK